MRRVYIDAYRPQDLPRSIDSAPFAEIPLTFYERLSSSLPCLHELVLGGSIRSTGWDTLNLVGEALGDKLHSFRLSVVTPLWDSVEIDFKVSCIVTILLSLFLHDDSSVGRFSKLNTVGAMDHPALWKIYNSSYVP